MKRILCYGDSNTWGLIPGSNPLLRYPENIRWTGILQEKLKDTEIIEEGLCGRTTVFEDAYRPGRNGFKELPEILEKYKDLDGVILMLGTNDCKTVYGATEEEIGAGIERCLELIEKYVSAKNVLLVSPILLGEDVWKPDKDPEFDIRSVEVSKKLKNIYEKISKKRGNLFLPASDYVSANDADCEHMDEEGHRIFADKVLEVMGGNYEY